MATGSLSAEILDQTVDIYLPIGPYVEELAVKPMKYPCTVIYDGFLSFITYYVELLVLNAEVRDGGMCKALRIGIFGRN